MERVDVFKVLPDQFFNILTGEKKQIYMDCVFIMYKYMGSQLSYSCLRDEIMPLLVDYFEAYEEQLFDDDGNIITDSRERASAVIRRLRQCEWISITTNTNYETVISFHDYTITIIQTLSNLLRNNKLELQGIVYQIYSNIKQADNASITVALNIAFEGTEKLTSELRKLSANIKKYIQKVIDQTNEDNLDELIRMHFVDYGRDDTYAAYHRLKTSDNVSKFRPMIIENLESIRENEGLLQIVARELVEIKTYETEAVALGETISKINQVIDQFKQLDFYLDEIDQKHSKYISTSISKIRFLINNTVDLPGKINRILKYLVTEIKREGLDVNGDSLEIVDDLFSIYTQSNIDYNSLYTVPKKNKTFTSQTIQVKQELSDAERQKRIEKLIKKNQYSKAKINEYVRNFLKDQAVINASSLPIETQSDFILIIYIYLYSNSRHMCYHIIRLKQKVNINGYSFDDFEIRRKQ